MASILSTIFGSSSWARTSDPMINSHMLCQLSYRGIFSFFIYMKDNVSVIFHIYSSFRQLSTLPGGRPPSTIDVKELNFRVRHGNGWILLAIVTGFSFLLKVCTLKTKQYINAFLRVFLSLFLFSSLLTISLDVAIHLTYSFSSKNMRFYSYRCVYVFLIVLLLNFLSESLFHRKTKTYTSAYFSLKNTLWSSPRTISTTQLHTLLHFHLWPINQVVFLDPYRTTPWEILS